MVTWMRLLTSRCDTVASEPRFVVYLGPSDVRAGFEAE
jgi:hypothetical protein